MATADDLTIAALESTARTLLSGKARREEALAEVRAITTDPRVLGRAAGIALGAHQAHVEGSGQGADVAQLLIDAGGDPAVQDEVAKQTRARLA